MKRAAPDKNGGAVPQIVRRQLMPTEEFASQQFDVVSLEEFWGDVGAEVCLGALSVVFDIMATQPGAGLVGVLLGQEISSKRKIYVAWEQEIGGRDRGAIRSGADEGGVAGGENATEEMVAALLGESAVCRSESPGAVVLAFVFGGTGLKHRWRGGPLAAGRRLLRGVTKKGVWGHWSGAAGCALGEVVRVGTTARCDALGVCCCASRCVGWVGTGLFGRASVAWGLQGSGVLVIESFLGCDFFIPSEQGQVWRILFRGTDVVDRF